MKLISEITETDILEHKNWKGKRKNNAGEYAQPDRYIEDLNEDEWYLTYTKYKLNDGSELDGFVSDLYQESHHRVFVNGLQISIGDWSPVRLDEYTPLCEALGKSVTDIYPVKYECHLTHWGNIVKGELSVDVE